MHVIYSTPIAAKIFRVFLWSRSVMLGSADTPAVIIY